MYTELTTPSRPNSGKDAVVLSAELAANVTVPPEMLPEVRRVVHDFGPDLPLLQPMAQQEQFNQSFSQERLFARLSVFFGLLAALLVGTGLYGTLAYKVGRRTAEIGAFSAIRTALQSPALAMTAA